MPKFKDLIIEGYSDVKSKSITSKYKPGTGSSMYPPAYVSFAIFKDGLCVVGLFGEMIPSRLRYFKMAPSFITVL